MKKTSKILILGIFLSTAFSCQLNELDNPNQITTSQARSNFILNKIQVDFADFFENASVRGMEATRMVHMSGENYTNTYTAATFDFLWNTAYTGLLVNMKDLKERGQPGHTPSRYENQTQSTQTHS